MTKTKIELRHKSLSLTADAESIVETIAEEFDDGVDWKEKLVVS